MRSVRRKEYGDFQTPQALADAACTLLRTLDVQPTHVLEPTCGRGSFLSAAARAFPNVRRLFGVEVNPEHFRAAQDAIHAVQHAGRVDLYRGDFFKFDWESIFSAHAGKWLIVGNPPWVTASTLASISSENLPPKANIDGLKGIEARTGKSNFDISEWMLLHHLDFLRRHEGWLAMLVKTSVARKLLARSWRRGDPVKSAAMYLIDATVEFGVSVDACLFFLEMEHGSVTRQCHVYPHIAASDSSAAFGACDGHLIADLARYRELRHLLGAEQAYRWRSGVKHDCSKVMEFTDVGHRFRNGFGEEIALEPTVMFPLLKSSDVANGRFRTGRHVLITQTRMGEDTSKLRLSAPLAWAYLESHSKILEQRGSSIYRKRAPFSIFGIGDYSFAPWKVAISGFYKTLRFAVVGPINGRPTLFDDTVYFLSCNSQAEALFLTEMLNSKPAADFLSAMIFWSDKRPITADILRRLSLRELAGHLGLKPRYEQFAYQRASQMDTTAETRLRA